MNLKQRLVCTAIVGTLSFASQTFATPASSSPFTGFYAGLSVGHSTMSAKKENALSSPVPYTFSGANDFSSSNVIGTLSLGYGIPLNESYNISLEPYVFLDSQRAKSSAGYVNSLLPPPNPQINETFQRKGGIGFKTSFGYLINPQTLLYGGVVIENSFFSAKVTVPGTSGATQKKNLWGIGPTVGVKLALTNKSSLELNCTYTIYEPYKRSFPLSPTVTFNSKVTPRFSIFKVGYSYKF